MVSNKSTMGFWAIIMGGSSGLGLATARKLAQHGYNLCVIHRDPRSRNEEIGTAFNEIKQMGIHFKSFNINALNDRKRAQVIDELKDTPGLKGNVRMLIHSIAKGNLKPMIEGQDGALLSGEDFDLTINAMATSLYDWTQALFFAELFSGDARIIGFTSEGNTRVWKNYAAVSAAKAALEAITRSIAMEFAPYGIRANCIQAGVTDTMSFRMIPGSDKIREITLMRNPYRRLTTPEDVANVVYLLGTEEAAWINGSVIPVDGGEHLS